MSLRDAASGLQRRLRSSGSLLWATPLVPPIITATVAPSLGPLDDGDTIASAMSANYDQTSNYSSAAGTISTVVAAATVNGVAALFTDTVDAGDVVAVTVTVTDSEANERVFNAGSRTVAGIAPTNDVAPSIAGDTSLGDTMTVTAGTWSGAPAPTLAYQWLRGGVEIAGETGTTYDITLADSGALITVRETATNSEGSASAVSNAITADTFTAPVNTVAPSIGGDTAVGSTLTRTTGTWSGNPTPAISGQWQRDGADISGATAATYVTVEADEGADITYLETATNAVGSASQASNAITVTAASAFTPASLFASGEEGAWYEPSPTTCFTDTAGTTPAAVGDSVARINDSSGNGNHATQATAAARPILARVPETGRRNLLEYTEEFNATAVWPRNPANLILTANAAIAPDGTTTADKFIPSTTSTGHFIQQSVTSSGANTFSFYAKAAEYNVAAIAINNTHGVWFSLNTQTFSNVAGAPTSYTFSDVGNGWYRISLVWSGSVTSVQIYTGPTASWAAQVGNGTDGILIWGAQFEEGTTATAYQKVVDQYDITEAGVDSLYYLDFDGVDDGFSLIYPTAQRTSNMQMVLGAEQDPTVTGLQVFLSSADGSNNPYVTLYTDGGGSPTDNGSGTPTHHVNNGADLASRDNIFDALNTGSPVVYEARGFDMTTSTWTIFGTLPTFGIYRSGSFASGIKMFSLIILANHTSAQLTDAREWVAGKIGATL